MFDSKFKFKFRFVFQHKRNEIFNKNMKEAFKITTTMF